MPAKQANRTITLISSPDRALIQLSKLVDWMKRPRRPLAQPRI
jgi:hypothetical protein